MKRITMPDERIEGGWKRAVIDPEEVKKYTMTLYWTLKKYEDTNLTPDEINALREIDNLVKNKFSGALTMKEIIGSFCEFYDANSDGERVAEARLLTNESVDKWEELNERDTAKEPEVHINSDETKVGSLVIGKGVKAYSCPKCSNMLRGSDNFCPECGQRLKR